MYIAYMTQNTTILWSLIHFHFSFTFTVSPCLDPERIFGVGHEDL